MQYVSATMEDLPAIRKLLARYHKDTIKPEDMPGGFVTTKLSDEQFRDLIEDQKGVTLAKDENGEVNDATSQIMMLWLGVMLGAQGAEAGVRALLRELAGQVEKKVLEAALAKSWVYSLAQQICKWIGVKLTEDGFAKAAGKIIPLVGAPISAGITYFTFKPMCWKLKKELDYEWENPL